VKNCFPVPCWANFVEVIVPVILTVMKNTKVPLLRRILFFVPTSCFWFERKIVSQITTKVLLCDKNLQLKIVPTRYFLNWQYFTTSLSRSLKTDGFKRRLHGTSRYSFDLTFQLLRPWINSNQRRHEQFINNNAALPAVSLCLGYYSGSVHLLSWCNVAEL
jgi:hypothetical protein